MHLLHVLSETAFVDRYYEKFLNSDFENDFIFLKNESTYNGKYTDKVTYWHNNLEGLERLAEHFHKYDGVILYYLDGTKMQLLEYVKSYNGKIFWSFFGAELYSLREFQNTFLSKDALKFKNYNSLSSLKALLIEFIRPYYWKLKNKWSPLEKLIYASKKIDGLIWYNKFEYDMLNKMLDHQLPAFVECSVSSRICSSNALKANTKIIMGNSGSIFNNHIEGIKYLAASNKKYSTSIPINYGATIDYKNLLKSEAEKHNLNIDYLENHIPYNEFIDYVNEHSTAVYPCYRQMGIGNIIIAIQCNLKIYLSEKNPTFPWLKSIGLKVFSIESQLISDLENDNLKLSQEDINHNQKVYIEFSSLENDIKYFQTLQKLVSK